MPAISKSFLEVIYSMLYHIYMFVLLSVEVCKQSFFPPTLAVKKDSSHCCDPYDMIGRASQNSLGYKDYGYGKTRLPLGAASPVAAIPGGNQRSCPVHTNGEDRRQLFACLLTRSIHPTAASIKE